MGEKPFRPAGRFSARQAQARLRVQSELAWLRQASLVATHPLATHAEGPPDGYFHAGRESLQYDGLCSITIMKIGTLTVPGCVVANRCPAALALLLLKAVFGRRCFPRLKTARKDAGLIPMPCCP